MDAVLRQVEQLPALLAVSRSAQVRDWDCLTLDRALEWARYFQHLHHRFRARPQLREALGRRLRRSQPLPLLGFPALGRCPQLLGLALLENRALPPAACRCLLRGLLQPPGEGSGCDPRGLALLARRKAAARLLALVPGPEGQLQAEARLLPGRLREQGQEAEARLREQGQEAEAQLLPGRLREEGQEAEARLLPGRLREQGQEAEARLLPGRLREQGQEAEARLREQGQEAEARLREQGQEAEARLREQGQEAEARLLPGRLREQGQEAEARLLLGRLREEGQEAAEAAGQLPWLRAALEQLPQPRACGVVAAALALLPQGCGTEQAGDTDRAAGSSQGGYQAGAAGDGCAAGLLLSWLLGDQERFSAFCLCLPSSQLAFLAGHYSQLSRSYLDLLTSWGSRLVYDPLQGRWVKSCLDKAELSWEELRERFICLCQGPALLREQTQAALELLRTRDGDFKVRGLSVWTDLLMEVGY
ncbi:Fanconi anemia group F protein [Lonchura striata]|uniref:Fanconi anemia group F protein n=1 Tax=Lonchura striata TaxID=40157 RepID=A0A218URX9_9PASE|nr:Fanconi anemia group F protein [Lonchura striata domestica]